MPLPPACPCPRSRSRARVSSITTGPRRALASRVLIGLLALLLAAPALARTWGRPLYVWTDGLGVVRYTSHPDDVPDEYRASLREVREIARVQDPDPGTLRRGRRAGAARPGDPGASATGVPGSPGGAGATGPPGPGGGPVRPELDDLDREIAALRAKIARDEEILKTLISDPEAAPALSGSSDLATIAKRLPEQQAQLRALLEERRRLQDGG